MESIARDREAKNLALNKEIIAFANRSWRWGNFIEAIESLLCQLEGSNSCSSECTKVLLYKLLTGIMPLRLDAEDIEGTHIKEIKRNTPLDPRVERIIKLWLEKYQGCYGLDLALSLVQESTVRSKLKSIEDILLAAGANPDNILYNQKLLEEVYQQHPNSVPLEEANQQPLDLVRIGIFLKALKGAGSCQPNTSRHLLLQLFKKTSVEHIIEVKEILRLWAEKRGDYSLNEALFIILEVDIFKEEKLQSEIFKALIELGADLIFPKVRGYYIPPGVCLSLVCALNGVKIRDSEDRQVNLEFLRYILQNRGGVALIQTLVFLERRDITLTQPSELLKIVKIVKENQPDLWTTFYNRPENITEAQVEETGEKIAKLYLYCKEEGITADEINNNKDWVLGFIHSPIDLKCLAAKTIKSYTKEEDINKLILPPSLKTFVEDPVISSAIKPVEIKK